ncbi:hypothetical protein FB446DRAFT_791451 [Lentinula raphanica]|nr:hypothetical protein FB446DRAFT_791451 [Lentinula raphanica]
MLMLLRYRIFEFFRVTCTARRHDLQGWILPKCNHQRVPFASKMYTREDNVEQQPNTFKKAFSVHAGIELLGPCSATANDLLSTSISCTLQSSRASSSLDQRPPTGALSR